mgnify:CR=1 FL=1
MVRMKPPLFRADLKHGGGGFIRLTLLMTGRSPLFFPPGKTMLHRTIYVIFFEAASSPHNIKVVERPQFAGEGKSALVGSHVAINHR